MARIHLDHRMRATANHGGIQIGSVEEAGQNRLARGGLVHGEPGEFAD
jgi:hypothetical protein